MTKHLLWVVAVVLSGAMAFADDAQDLFDAGAESYRAGDMATAAQQFEAAARLGHVRAELQIGWHYEFGQGVGQDANAAFTWYAAAAWQGDATAEANLGTMYLFGRGTAQDIGKAIEWYQKAARQGEGRAMYQVGWMLENGYGVTQDLNKALGWYRAGANAGDEKAATAVAQLTAPRYDGGGWGSSGSSSSSSSSSGSDAPKEDWQAKWDHDTALQNSWEAGDMEAHDRIERGESSDSDKDSYGGN